MAHPYEKYRQDLSGKAKAKTYQTGGKVRDDQSLSGRETPRRDNYEAGVHKMKGPFASLTDLKAGSFVDRAGVDRSYLNTIEHDRAVPRRKED